VFDEGDEALGGGLKQIMFEGQQEKLKLTENAQPAILMTSIALLRVLEHEFGFDVEKACSYALGHSLGEYSALVATKSLSLYDAVKLVRLRGEAMSRAVADKGVQTAMSALVVRGDNLVEIEKSMDEVQKDLPPGELVELANINSSFQVVISGTKKGVDHASRFFQSKKLALRAVDLPVSAPFHCSLMQPVADEMREAIADVKFSQPVVEVISNVTTRPHKDLAEIPKLLVKQVTSTVGWYKSIMYCKNNDIENFISFGPGKVLSNLLKKEYPLDRIRSIATVEDIKLQADYLRSVIQASSSNPMNR
jgi:[acyl-carrier-protein] S-malonyltransferase